MELDDRTKTLIAVGASVAANCQSCLRSTVSMARESGADVQQIGEAIEVGKRVRRGAASKMDELALVLTLTDPLTASPLNSECACGAATESAN